MPRKKTQAYYGMIKNFINKYWEENGVSPTTSEIANGTGIPRATTGRYLAEMKEKGQIVYDGRRDFRTKEHKVVRFSSVPIVGSIACGLPRLAQQDIEGYLKLSKEFVGRGKFYLLRASGESMIKAGIHTDDLVLIREQPTAEYGQIVVAQVGDEDATLKTYRPEEDRIILHPENDAMEDIVVDPTRERFVIQGVAKEVIHKLP